MSRLSLIRIVRIGAWTAVATGWASAAIASTLPPPGDGATAPQAPPLGPTGNMEVTIAPREALPALPRNGLVVIRHTPAELPAAEPIVVQRVVVQAGPAPAPAAAPVVSSRGS